MQNYRDEEKFLLSSESVRYLIYDVGLPLNKAPEALGLSSTEFMKWWADRTSSQITLRNLEQLGQYLNISEEQILNKTYDKDYVRSLILEGHSFLPEKYANNKYSCLRSSAHIFKYIARTRGQHFADQLMRRMRVSPLIYSNLDNKISLNYFVDLLDVLSENGFSQQEIDSLASVVFLSIEGTQLGEMFKKANNYFDCYGVLSASAEKFDSNFIYDFDINNTGVVIRAYIDYDKLGELNLSYEKIYRLLRYRRFLMGWFPYLSNLPPVYPEQIDSLSQKGLITTYKISFDTQPMRLISSQNSD